MHDQEIHLFRIRILESNLYPLNRSRAELLYDALNERPSIKKGVGINAKNWQIGNLHFFGLSEAFFALGRTTSTLKTEYDEETGNFIIVRDKNAPYTFIAIDLRTGVVGIMHKSKLSSDTQTIANILRRLLLQTISISSAGVNVLIDRIFDSNEFMRILKDAFSIKRFTFEFTPPNPEDAEEDYQKRYEEFIQRANGRKGKTIIEGNNLNPKVLEPITRSSIASGNEVTATIQERRDNKTLKKVSSARQSLKLVLSVPEYPNYNDIPPILEKIQYFYQDIRRRENDNK